jgi:hypothetical protein
MPILLTGTARESKGTAFQVVKYFEISAPRVKRFTKRHEAELIVLVRLVLFRGSFLLERKKNEKPN